jgi:hypothetical protein
MKTVLAIDRIVGYAGNALPALIAGIAIQTAPALAGEPNGASFEPVLTDDGRFVAFHSDASNFVSDDENDRYHDVFLRDRETGETILVSVSSSGEQGNRHSGAPSVSADARFIAFQSEADNLVEGDANGSRDIFLRDRETGQTNLISTRNTGEQDEADSWKPSISSDGCIIAFETGARLAPDDTRFGSDIYVHDCRTSLRTRISRNDAGQPGDGQSNAPAVSADGSVVAFESYASNLVVDDTNDERDVFVHELDTGRTIRVSVNDAGDQGNRDSFAPSISADGRYVAFYSWATNLVPDDTNERVDVFVHDRMEGVTRRVSVNSLGEQANDQSFVFHRYNSYISNDGRYIAFSSDASNLVPGDTNNTGDVFLYDRQTGDTLRLSVSTTGAEGDFGSEDPSISADGRIVAFVSAATTLTPGNTVNTYADIFVRDVVAMQTTRIETGDDGTPLTEWLRVDGGVVASSNELSFMNSPRGWWSGAYSPAITGLGFVPDNFEVRFTAGRFPDRSTWAVGLGSSETGTHWSDIEYGFRSIDGVLDIRDNSAWVPAGDTLAFGDVLSIKVSSGPNDPTAGLEYRLNGRLLHQSNLARPWYSETFQAVSPLYVDTAFRDGFVSLAVTVLGADDSAQPPFSELTDWFGHKGGVTTSGNRIDYDGAQTDQPNTVNSSALSTVGFTDYISPGVQYAAPGSDRFEVRFTIESDPQRSTWVVGLGSFEARAALSDIEFGLRSDDGVLSVRENGNWRTGGAPLQLGDVLSLLVVGGEKVVEYAHNGVPIYATAYSGSPSFYVDTAFKEGAISLSTSVHGVPADIPDGSPLTDWTGESGGVSATDNVIVYTGTPTGWQNTIRSSTLRSMGFVDDYEVRFTLDSDPAGTNWSIGLGTVEDSDHQADIEFGLQSNGGVLAVRENGTWRKGGAILSTGDVLSMLVSNGSIEYRQNGVPIYSTTYVGAPEFYVDSAFRDGAIRIQANVVDCDTPECANR